MASAETTGPTPGVPAAAQNPESNVKVTVVPNTEDNFTAGHVASHDADAIKHPSAMTNGGSERERTNGEPKSYAAAVKTASSRSHEARRVDGDDSYPPLPGGARALMQENHASGAYSACGIRFAPLKVPLVRRLQTAAVLLHSMSLVVFMSLFWFTCANPLTWPLLVPYLVHICVSSVATNGNMSFRSEFLRSLHLWDFFSAYFPATLHKTHDLPPNRRYIFGYHPHGIISHGAWCAFATNALGFAEKFPGITNSLLTLDSNFRIPFYRDWILAMGLRSVSKEAIMNILSKGGVNNNGQGRAVTIVIGGARESLEATPGSLRLILEGRKGFAKMALRTGADLVPVLAFGENDLYDQLSPKKHPLVQKFQMVMLKLFSFTLPAMHGRGLLNYDFGLMPYRRPVDVVVGKPIMVEKSHGPQPEQADIDRLHDLYVEEVVKVWDTYKDQFAPARTSELQIIA